MPGEICGGISCFARFRAVRDLRFSDGSASLGFGGTRGLAAGKWGDLRGLFQIQTGRAEHDVFLARSLVVKLKHAQNKFCGLTAVIQSRNRRCRVFGCRELFVCPRAGEERQGVSGYCST